ncbi:hypothetical protein GN244_ATG12762 [Phytophthora infestans]|uniref:Uncharacterized protein n=1 Tax=Phytophthora infestans TaxID=4787 RepID=A0A833SZA4_PHYIN|nr:hypothetical protein GN244_ATG12762 [Phytophthora infestans]
MIEMLASKQAETSVDSAIAAALKELNDESKGYNIADCDGSESVTVQMKLKTVTAEQNHSPIKVEVSWKVMLFPWSVVLRLRRTMNAKYPKM